MDSDYKKLLNKEGITISNALKQINKSLKDFNIKKDIRQTTSFKEYNLDEILDEVLENEKEIYDLELNNTSIEDETFDYDINNDDTKVFQFINLLISSPSISNYVKLILKKLYKIDDYYDEVIMPKLIDKLNYDAKEYYLFNYDICVELLDTINNIEYEYDNLNIIQSKDKCFIHFKKQITINNIKIPKYLKVKRIEINDKTYTGVNLLKALLFNEINDKIKFICNNNIEFSINKEILFGKSKQEDNLMASEFVKYLMNIVNEIPSSNTKKEIADILSKIYNVKPQKEKNKSKEEKQMQKEENYLERYGENLTKMHYLKDPSIGRDDIIRKIERILLYPEKDKSIIITGPAGTGKTAVVKGLAYRIQNNLVPEALKDIEIISIDAPSIVSGCKYVGMLEEKLKGILDEACFDKNIILFMDEIQDYYRLTKDYLIYNEFVADEIRTVDFSTTNLHTTNQNILNNFEIYPLQNSVTSLTGKKSVSFSVRNKTSLDKDRTFNFNKDIKHYCYVADGNDLAYNFGLIGDGTIMLRAYFDGKNNQQCILESEDENGHSFKFYRNNNDELIMKYLLVEYNTRLKCLNDKWYTIAFSYRYTLSSDSYGNPELVFRVFVKADDAAANGQPKNGTNFQ